MADASSPSQSYNSKQEAPSNIAIVKYWGKKGVQEPVNPSISFTLDKAVTRTDVEFQPGDQKLSIEFYFENSRREDFEPKINAFIRKVQPFLPFLEKGHLIINSSNTFPHSSGIASSASSMAALAKCFCDIQYQLTPSSIYTDIATLSSLARQGSGSGARSVDYGWSLWGKTPEMAMGSDNYAVFINDEIHPLFQDIKDAILVIESGQKKVSSTAGHQLMNNHPYRNGRITQANENTRVLLDALTSGDFDSFISVCEEEALSLHGLMMSSRPGYTLLSAESIIAIEKIRTFRKEQQVPITFTIDAGPNIHVLYPGSAANAVEPFIKEELSPLCQNKTVLYDTIRMPQTVTNH